MKALDLALAVSRRVTRQINLKPALSRLDAPLASITFDDFPKSAWTLGASVLGRWRVKATYYASGTYVGRCIDGVRYYDPEDLRALVAEGHELACHGYSHEKAPGLDATGFDADLQQNRRFLAPYASGGDLVSFAYPFGEASPRTKAQAAARFASARGIGFGVNRGVLDLSELKAVGVERAKWRPERIHAAIEEARRTRGWLIFFTHDVSPDPSAHGATPDMLEMILAALSEKNIEILPVRQAVRRAVMG